jgi:hypothetical protein
VSASHWLRLSASASASSSLTLSGVASLLHSSVALVSNSKRAK